MAEIANVVRFIGDVHQSYDDYLPLLRGVKYSVQVGDLGLSYAHLRKQQKIDWRRHKAIAGNHDCYQEDSPEYHLRQPFMAGEGGILPLYDPTSPIPGRLVDLEGDEVAIFYVRGAWSIDQKYRTVGIDWWPQEELPQETLNYLHELYVAAKPKYMVSHEAPLSVIHNVTNPRMVAQYGFTEPIIRTRTNQALQRMLEAHRPRFWFFGHYHRPWTREIDGTTFVCLDTVHNDTHVRRAYFDLPLAD
jgi:predicted phosphodiesterase